MREYKVSSRAPVLCPNFSVCAWKKDVFTLVPSEKCKRFLIVHSREAIWETLNIASPKNWIHWILAYSAKPQIYIFRYLEVCEILRKSKGTINIRFSVIFRTFSGVFPLFKRTRNQTIQCWKFPVMYPRITMDASFKKVEHCLLYSGQYQSHSPSQQAL